MLHTSRIARAAAAGLLLAATAAHAREGEGDHHHHAVDHAITTAAPEAQRLFGIGLGLVYGFNHDQAAQTFRQATAADPDCAMCWWGVALSLGPNINFPMDRADQEEVWATTQKATALAPRASARERAYIEALSHRYSAAWTDDRTELDSAYAKAMRRVAHRFPQDLDAATLFAEALMDTTPWDYWLADGSPKPVTEEFLGVLESVLKRDATHPGAAHYLIHAVEKARPELGVPAADQLAAAPQATGHLRHMASHIYLRVGRYHDAVRVNQEAIESDRQLLAGEYQPGEYTMILAPHNVHMLWAAGTLEGQSELALEAAGGVRAAADPQTMREAGLETLQHYWLTPLYHQVRFGRWDEILAEPEPAADLLYPRGVWHYARGMAFTRQGRLDQAAPELERLAALAEEPRLAELTVFGLNTMQSLLQIARGVLAGELAAARGEVATAVSWLEGAVALEDGLAYDEPPPWHLPVRQVLGQVLLDAGRSKEAEQVYRADLEVFPHNGWSLWGLAQSLEAQRQVSEAKAARAELEHAWQYADVTLAASRF